MRGHHFSIPLDSCTRCLSDYRSIVVALDGCPGMFSCCNGKSPGARWDGPNLRWVCKDCGKPQKEELDLDSMVDSVFKPYAVNTPKCECGADATYGVGSGMHSATMPCPLYKKP